MYYSEYKKFGIFLNPKTSYIFDKTWAFSIICSKSGNKNDGIFKEEESTDILKIICSTE